MKPNMSLAEILNETDAIIADVQSAFGQLNAEQLNWKPNAEAWSVAQCLDHLIVINGPMLAPFDQLVSGTKPTRFMERLPFWPGMWGGVMIKMLQPEATKKLKSPPTVVPSSSKLDPSIINRFVTHQQELKQKLRAVENLNPEKVIMTSPFAGFITYSLLDAARIVIVHERRHFEQAKRVMATEGFPR